MARKAWATSLRAVSVLCGTMAGVATLGVSSPCQAYTEKTLYSFCSAKSCKDGDGPNGLVMDPSGNLFGVTYSGGKYGAGTVFGFVPATGQYSVLHNFCKKTGCPDGSNPGRVNLVIDVNGNLYGTTMKGGDAKNPGGGVVFELVKSDSGWHEVTLYDFCASGKCASKGDLPSDGLSYAGAASGQLYDGSSPLFGTTSYGGAHGGGTAFSLTPQLGSKRWTEQVLYSFCSQTNCVDGEYPDTPLYIDSEGNIYGTTPNGGESNTGVVFELSPGDAGYTESVLHSFCTQQNCGDGDSPYGGVIADSQGNLYGTALGGGAGADGLVFELSPNGTQWQFVDLADFNGTDGAGPRATLFMDSTGNLFGTTVSGGSNDKGTVFAFNGSVQSLYSFCPERGCADGKYSFTNVVEDSAGNLYGVTSQGGSGHDGGTLYELSPYVKW